MLVIAILFLAVLCCAVLVELVCRPISALSARLLRVILGGSLLYYSQRIWHWLRHPRVCPVMRLPQSGTSSV
jgi:hypothetical protein